MVKLLHLLHDGEMKREEAEEEEREKKEEEEEERERQTDERSELLLLQIAKFYLTSVQ